MKARRGLEAVPSKPMKLKVTFGDRIPSARRWAKAGLDSTFSSRGGKSWKGHEVVNTEMFYCSFAR
jgi:hypothetical protein